MGKTGKLTVGKTLTIALFAAVMLYPFLFVTLGVDLTDSGFSIATSAQIFPYPERTLGSVWLSNLAGGLWGGIFGFSLLSFRLFASTLVSASSLVVFLGLRRKMKEVWLLASLLFSEMLLRRFVVVGGYNQVSIFLACVSYALLINGLAPRKPRSIILAGAACGLAVLARLPSIVFVIPFCAALAASGILGRTGPKRFLADTGYALAGFFSAIWVCLMFLALRGEAGWFLDSALSTFASGAGNTTSHGFLAMMETIARDHARSLPLTMAVLGALAAGAAGFVALSGKKLPRLFDLALLSMAAAAILVFLIFGKPLSLKSFDTMTMVLLQVIAITLLTCAIACRSLSQGHRLMAWIGFGTIMVVPFGTNNGLRFAVNASFLFLPALFAIIAETARRHPETGGRQPEDAAAKLSGFLIPLCIALLIAFAGTASFALSYVYRDAPHRELRTELDIPGLKGQKTTIERAEELNALNVGIGPYLATDRSLIAYGAIPLLHVMTGMPAALDSPWPDLEDFPEKTMESGLTRCAKEGTFPLVVISRTNTRRATWPLKAEVVDRSRDGKYLSLMRFIDAYGYGTVYEDNHFVVYDKER